MSDDLFPRVRREEILFKAWRSVYKNGISSKSKITRNQITEFDKVHIPELRKIAKDLRENKYSFMPAIGIAQTKPGKDSIRPVVIATVRDRIVQRAILDVLQSHPPIKKYINVKTSFGGIKDRGVSDAIRFIYNTIQSGNVGYYIKSDIKSFFTQISKNKVKSIVSNTINDDPFIDLFSKALNVELENYSTLGKHIKDFPIFDLGVAQGSCLSPLMGNLLLNQFDIEMNYGDIVCVRYIDDFIILGPNIASVNAAYKKALKLLSLEGLTAYDPKIDKGKAAFGQTSKMFNMLGCDIRPGMIKPDSKAKARLLYSISELLNDSISLMDQPSKIIKSKLSMLETLNTLSNIKKGWGNQYSFCNDLNEFRQLDIKIDALISKYHAKYQVYKDKLEIKNARENRARMLGIHLLTDSKKDPIVSNTI